MPADPGYQKSFSNSERYRASGAKSLRMPGSTKSLVFEQHPEAEVDEHQTHFNKSLQEVGELRSQLHHAADYCEATFLNAPQKQMMIENTKEYLCRAIVTVVDHLGGVSANLDHQLSKTNSVLETEFRMNNLKQKLTTCQQYSHKLALSRLSWNADFPRYQPRYITPSIPNLRRSDAILKELGDAPKAQSTISKQESDTKEEVPLVSYKYKTFLVEDSSIVSKRIGFSTPVKDGLVLQPKPQHQLFQFQEKHKLKRRMQNWKPLENNDLISLIRWGKRTA